MKVQVANAAEVVERLLAVGSKRAKQGLRKGSRSAAKALAAAVESEIPSASGKARAAVKVRALARSRRRVGATVRIWIRQGDTPYYAFRDLGTRKLRGGRYFDRAFRSAHTAAERILIDAVLAEVNKP